MSLLWCGGEDIDFPNGSVCFAEAAQYRSAFSRCSLYSGGLTSSNPFAGGALTSAWLSCQFGYSTSVTSAKQFGFVLSGTGGHGLYVGTGVSNASQTTLYKWDGATLTALAQEAGASLAFGVTQQVVMQVVNYGATATVNVYLNGNLVLTFSGNVTVSGMTNFDSVAFCATTGANCYFSEFMVANEDVRSWALSTLAPNGNGTTQQWTGSYSTIDQVSFSDTTPNYTNTDNQDQQFTLNALSSGSWQVKGTKITARAAVSSSPTPTHIKLGYRQGSTVAVGSNLAPTTAYATYEQLDTTNPVTSTAWAQSDFTGLQLDMRSAA